MEKTDQIQSREGDGSILGELIAQGIYTTLAGSEKIGYFDPNTTLFHTFPNGTTGMQQSEMAELYMEMLKSVDEDHLKSMYGSDITKTKDIAITIAQRLNLTSTKEILEIFPKLVRIDNISQFLIATTTMPFFLTYCKDIVKIVSEVDHELKLNSIANLFLNDKDFKSIDSIKSFETKLESLIIDRKQEFEEKKQWAIDHKKTDSIEYEDNTEIVQQNEGNDGGCYIATATFNDYNHPTVIIYREFRDCVLMNSIYGKLFIRIYYKISPLL